uniref:Uncharacterized protein n=1 Tax=Scleropages formosus TaxID=113540 RepID=A0A8C9VZ86_SCLFO
YLIPFTKRSLHPVTPVTPGAPDDVRLTTACLMTTSTPPVITLEMQYKSTRSNAPGQIVQAFRSSGITQSAGPPTSPAPIKYDGVSDNYQGFLMQMKPRLWKSRVPSTYEAFKKCFEAVFDHPLPAHSRLLNRCGSAKADCTPTRDSAASATACASTAESPAISTRHAQYARHLLKLTQTPRLINHNQPCP